MNKKPKKNQDIKQEPKIKISLDLAGKVSKSSGETVKQALEKLVIPRTFKIGVVTLQSPKGTVVMKIPPRVMNRLAGSPLMRELTEKRLSIEYSKYV